MILVVYVLTPVTMSSTKSLFQWLRIAQTRMMVLSIIHGLRPNPKLKAILEGCANLDHLWGPSLTSHNLFWKECFLPNCLYIRFAHILNMQPNFTLGLPCAMFWIESTANPENTFNSATPSWFMLNWPSDSGVNIRTSMFGPESLFLFVVLTIAAWNLPSYRVATPAQLSFYLPIFPPSKRTFEATCHEYQCPSLD